ncbi:MAG: CBS domain-containing protein [Candidatus Bathyarchaeia archaeon]|jgi:predicted transcriptional regulator|nr:CBS domain-containing protein [Candidatus Bathyarchaeota archaeon A05DMB-4]MDH7595479.1 CBS domain-containing protein [Candidatus Bathyarchaeota archaeon]
MIITGAMVRKLREDAGLTQGQLAQLIGVTQAHIAKIENNKVDPRLSTVNKILQVLTEGEGKKCREIMTKNVISARPTDKILKISEIMMKNAVSQLPVVERDKVIGTITEESIIRNLSKTIADATVAQVMEPPLPIVPEETSVSIIRPLLEDHPGVLVAKKGNVVGIITRSDLLKIVSKTL